MPLVLIKSDKKAREKPCLRCGYSLRRIDSLHCPECGLSVWRSLNQNDALDWSNPPWLLKLAGACRVLAVVQLVGLVAYVLAQITFLVLLMRAGRPIGWWLHAHRFLPLVAGAYEIGLAAGLVLLAAEEGRHPDKWKPFKWACRIVAALSALAALLMFLVAGAYLVSPRGLFQSTLIGYALNFAIIGGVLAAIAYLRKLAQRIPNSRVAKICGWLLLAPAISLLKAVPIFAVWIAFDLFGYLFTFLPIVYLPATAILLLWFARQFRQASVVAEKGWSSETAGAC